MEKQIQQQQQQQQYNQEQDKQQRQKHQQEEKEEEEEEEQTKQHQEQQKHHKEEKQLVKELEKQEEGDAENKQNQTVSQFPLSRRSTPQRAIIPKAQSPPSSYKSPVDSPLSSNHSSSLSHGFSPPPPPTKTTSQPSEPNSKPPTPPVAVSKAEFASTDQSTTTTVEVEEQTQKLGSASGKRLRHDLSILRRPKRDKMVKKALLGFRISGFVFCLVSFSVLAADRDQGWALDSFYRYKEFRFCLAVNVIGFVYSGIQACDLAFQLTSGKQKSRSHFRCYLDFVLDQMLAYLLISASSAAAVRVDDWESNWGKDKFPEMARASMALSLVAFIALALSSLVSGYALCNFKSM